MSPLDRRRSPPRNWSGDRSGPWWTKPRRRNKIVPMTRRRPLRLGKRIFFSYSIIVVLILVLTTLGLTFYLSSNFLDREAENLTRLALKSADQVDDKIKRLMETVVQVGLTPSCVEVFAKLAREGDQGRNRFEHDYFDEAGRIKAALAGIRYIHYSTGRISLYDTRGNYLYFGSFPVDRDKILRTFAAGIPQDLARRLEDLDGKVLVLDPHADYWSSQPEDRIVSVLWNIKDIDTNRAYGMVEIQEGFREVTSLVEPSETSDIDCQIIGPDDAVLWSKDAESDTAVPWISPSKAIPATGREGIVRSTAGPGGGNSLIAWSRPSLVPWTILYSRGTADILAPLRFTLSLLLLASLLVMLLSLSVVQVLSVRLTRPLRRLRDQLDKVDLDNLSVTLESSGDADLTFINRAFNDMFTRLRTSTDLLIVAQAEESKAQLLALQSQMDPHFLFNIISVLSAEARLVRSDKLVAICANLAKLVRYVSDYECSATTLFDEFDHTRTYLTLMQCRFETGLRYQLLCGEEAKGIHVPKLILQPLVENSFHHGFADLLPPWKIVVEAEIDQVNWRVRIGDNGTGISPECREELLQRVEHYTRNPQETIGKLHIGGLGLLNSFIRLRLLYGEGAIMAIRSSPEGGTEIEIGGPR